MNTDTSARWTVGFEQRRCQIAGAHGEQMELALDQGEQQCIVLTDAAAADALIAALDACPQVGILPADGGLPGALSVAENLALALTWDTGPVTTTAETWDFHLQLAFRLCGFTAERSVRLGRQRLLDLGRSERWQVGFIRYLVRPPELLVFDRVFTGRSPAEAKIVSSGIAVFHAMHPFRSTLCIDLAGHGPPHVASTEVLSCPC